MELACSGCEKRFDLSADYVAAHGGGTFACECGQVVTIPTPDEMPADVGSSLFPLPSRGRILNSGVWADGVYVVVARGTKLPKTCRRCNTPVESTKTRSLKWIPREARRANGAPAVVAAMMAESYSKSIAVRVGACPKHDSASLLKKIAFCLAWLCIASFVLGFVVGMNYAGYLFAASLIFLGAMIVTLRLRKSFRVVHVKGDHFWIDGFGDGYLDALPQYVQAFETDLDAAAVDLNRVD